MTNPDLWAPGDVVTVTVPQNGESYALVPGVHKLTFYGNLTDERHAKRVVCVLVLANHTTLHLPVTLPDSIRASGMRVCFLAGDLYPCTYTYESDTAGRLEHSLTRLVQDRERPNNV